MVISQKMQVYAAEIYRLQQDYDQVPLSLLIENINISTQALAKMVQRMKTMGFLNYEPYRGATLTADGERIAMPALRRHRLVEVFLVRAMKYDWASAHELADQFALGVNDEIEDRMDDLSDHPKHCPHGEPIPGKDGVIQKLTDKILVNVPSGSECQISRVRTHESDKLRYIAELGLLPGVSFHLLSCAPFKGPLRLQINPLDHVISYELARLLWVNVLKEGQGNKPVSM